MDNTCQCRNYNRVKYLRSYFCYDVIDFKCNRKRTRETTKDPCFFIAQLAPGDLRVENVRNTVISIE